MLQRTNKIFIGKDIDRTAAVVGGATMTTLIANIVEGEVVVLDKFRKVLNAGDTVADSDSIYVCQGTGDTYDYTNESGTTVTGVRKLRISDEIQGASVRIYNGISYDAKNEQTIVFDLTGLVPVAGTEYLIRVVYKDMNEHPGQFTQTYRVIASSNVLHTGLIDLFDTKINTHSGRRVNATHTATSITLTGRAIPECTNTLNDFDKFSMVEFDAFFNYVDADGYWVETPITSKTITPADFGQGTWELMRDEEKETWGYLGITNRTHYPVVLPSLSVVKNATYDQIVIEHDVEYLSPDNQIRKKFPCTTKIACVVPTAAHTMENNILAQLNPWMASCPGAFAAISL